jgi:hypothetical protein
MKTKSPPGALYSSERGTRKNKQTLALSRLSDSSEMLGTLSYCQFLRDRRQGMISSWEIS